MSTALDTSFWMASLTVLLYEIIVTFDEEVEFMWRGRFVWTRILYFLNRYFPLLNLLIDNILESTVHSSDFSTCNFWFRWFMYTIIIGRISMSGILIMRLYLMYCCNRTFLITLCVLFVIELVIESTIIGEVIYALQDWALPMDITTPGCAATGIKPWAWVYWIPIMIWEALLLALSLYRSAQQAREEAGTPRLMIILLRDSILYFGGALASILANFIVWKVQVIALFFALIPVNIALNSVLGCRMMLHIARAGRKHRLAVAERSYPRTSGVSADDANENRQDRTDEGNKKASHEAPEAYFSHLEHSRASSTTPLKDLASDHDGLTSPSSPDPSNMYYGPVIEITREESTRLDWDIYVRRNDL
ncbi:hypothetical protein DAEQUDRAFT_732999 [Daedalea quercina L-15889]|uniref:DUF6533 domain-containing protein n=1 Tax=Daedalea quercina L-15889 TaxID=1314783 RepID=A0A165LA30_9APHY|nr:hypothetical protein DAEQUDRAFT_732999 [Daedalea quercina L-15889]